MAHVNPEERRAYARAYRAKNLEKMLANERARRIVRRETDRINQRAWADANREKVRASERASRQRRKAMVMEKKAGGCLDCGEADIRVIQLHAPQGHTVHRKSIGDGSRFSYAALRAELNICIPLCANCHIRRHVA